MAPILYWSSVMHFLASTLSEFFSIAGWFQLYEMSLFLLLISQLSSTVNINIYIYISYTLATAATIPHSE